MGNLLHPWRRQETKTESRDKLENWYSISYQGHPAILRKRTTFLARPTRNHSLIKAFCLSVLPLIGWENGESFMANHIV